MSTPEPTPEAVEALARLFHEEYERAAVGHGWETQERSRVPWGDVPEANKATMLTTCRAVLATGCPDDADMCDWLIHSARAEASTLRAENERLRAQVAELDEWRPGRWYRAVAPDGTLWLETSNPDEVSDRARHGDRLERLYDSVQRHEWRAWDPENSKGARS